MLYSGERRNSIVEKLGVSSKSVTMVKNWLLGLSEEQQSHLPREFRQLRARYEAQTRMNHMRQVEQWGEILRKGITEPRAFLLVYQLLDELRIEPWKKIVIHPDYKFRAETEHNVEWAKRLFPKAVGQLKRCRGLVVRERQATLRKTQRAAQEQVNERIGAITLMDGFAISLYEGALHLGRGQQWLGEDNFGLLPVVEHGRERPVVYGLDPPPDEVVILAWIGIGYSPLYELGKGEAQFMPRFKEFHKRWWAKYQHPDLQNWIRRLEWDIDREHKELVRALEEAWLRGSSATP